MEQKASTPTAPAAPATPLADDIDAFHKAVDAEMAGTAPAAPQAAPAGEPAGEPAPGTAPAAPQPSPGEGEGEAGHEPSQDQHAGKKRTVSARISELVSQKNAERSAREQAEAKAAAIARELEDLKASASKGTPPAGTPPAAAPKEPGAAPKRPRADDFYDESGRFKEDEYEQAMESWQVATTRAAVAEALRSSQAPPADPAQQAYQETMRKWTEREAAYVQKNPDYPQAAQNLRALLWTQAGLPRNPALAKVIFTHQDGVRLAHILGANPDLADRAITTMDEAQLGILLAAEAGLRPAQSGQPGTVPASGGTPVTNAPEPPPIDLAGANPGPTPRDPFRMSMDQFMTAAGTDRESRLQYGRG